MRAYPFLSDPAGYRPQLWDLPNDPQAVSYWKTVFQAQLVDMTRRLTALRGEAVGHQAEMVSDRFFARLTELEVTGWGRYRDIHGWTILREQLLGDLGIDDPYREVKETENERALGLFATTLADVREATTLDRRLNRAIAGIHAGNLFDLGSPATAREHAAGGDRFAALTADVLNRPLAVDGRDALARKVASLEPGATVVVLVDNAGPDFICGVLPFAVVLLERGLEVFLAANATPTLNDITHAEAAVVLERATRVAPGLDELVRNHLRLVSTGTGEPGIDLGSISDDLAEIAATASLLVLEGQGRAIETNWNTRIDQPVFRVSTVKDPMVARYLGVELYALVADFRPSGRAAPPRAVGERRSRR